jgi:voltage-gated potassium channel
MAEGWRKLSIGFILVVTVVAIGTVGFRTIGLYNGQDWAWFDCVYMTVITVSTVGYGEVLPFDGVPAGRLFAMLLIVFGMGILLYFATSVVGLVVESNLDEVFKRRKLDKGIKKLEKHVIVCGAGTTGIHVIEELVATKTPFVVIDTDAERLEWIASHLGSPFLHIVGDATDDDILVEAGIGRAIGVVTALPSDKDNLFVTLTARHLNSSLRIVSRARETSAKEKIRRAGANTVVSPNHIGGMRMVSEMIRPEVTQFLDLMLRDKDRTLRIEEATIPAGSAVIGKTLAEAQLRKVTDLLVIAARRADGAYQYNPGPGLVLDEGTTLIVLGPMEHVVTLRRHLEECSEVDRRGRDSTPSPS